MNGDIKSASAPVAGANPTADAKSPAAATPMQHATRFKRGDKGDSSFVERFGSQKRPSLMDIRNDVDKQDLQGTQSAPPAAPFLTPEEEAALRIRNSEPLPQGPAPAENEADGDQQYPALDLNEINLNEQTEKETKEFLLASCAELALSKEGRNEDIRQKAIAESAAAISNITYRNFLLAKENSAKEGDAALAYAGESYGDDKTRGAVLGLMAAATSIEAVSMVVGAISNLSVGLVGEALKAMELEKNSGKILENFKNAKESRHLNPLARGVANLVRENEAQRALVAKDGALVQKLLSSIDNNNLAPQAREASIICLQTLFSDKEKMKEVGFDSKENFDKMFAAAKSVDVANVDVQNERARGCSLKMLMAMVQGNPQYLEGEAGEQMKDMMLEWSKTAQDPYLINTLSAGFEQFSKLQNEGVSMQDEDTKKTLFEMGRNAKGPDAISAAMLAIARVTWEIHKKREGLSPDERANFNEIYGDEETHEFLQEMIGKVDKIGSKEGDKARGAVAGAIASVCLGDKAAAKFCNEETKKTMLDWGNRAKTDEGIAGVAAAISSMAHYEGRVLEQNRSNVFAGDPKVKDALAAMKAKLGGSEFAHTDKSTQDRAASQIDVADKNIDFADQQSNKKSGESWAAKMQERQDSAKSKGGGRGGDSDE